MSDIRIVVVLIVASLLAGCVFDDPPCASPEATKKAADAYAACISVNQRGEGGYQCGSTAYDTFCKARMLR